jgi:protein required for attachment to host cells
MVDTWVVVADGSGCRIFSSDASLTKLVAVKELKNKHHGSEHRGHSAKGHDSVHHATEAKFAGDIGDEITRAVQAHEVRDVLLVAPKRFLGDLLGSLPKPTADHVTAKVPKDFTTVEPHALAQRLRDALAENHDLH